MNYVQQVNPLIFEQEEVKAISTNRSRCRSSHIILVRDYISGEKVGLTTVDIKWNTGSYKSALHLPFWPSDHYASNSTQSAKKTSTIVIPSFQEKQEFFFLILLNYL